MGGEEWGDRRGGRIPVLILVPYQAKDMGISCRGQSEHLKDFRFSVVSFLLIWTIS